LNNISLGNKLFLGIGTVLVLLITVAVWSLNGIGRMVDDGLEVVEGNRLRGEILQREIDHLNWASRVGAFINDETVTDIGIQLDHTKCGFGKWYYGDGRPHAEKLVPDLAPVLALVGEPHKLLHESARKIEKVFKRADPNLPDFLAQKKVDHLIWSGKVQNAILLDLKSVKVQLDHTKCGLGRFIYGEAGNNMRRSDSEQSDILDAIEPAHKRLHAAVDRINAALKLGDRDVATSLFQLMAVPALSDVRDNMDRMQIRARHNLDGKKAAERIFATETQIQLKAVKQYFHDLIGITSENILSEQQMLTNAADTRIVVIVVFLVAIILGGVLGFWFVVHLRTLLSGVVSNISSSSAQIMTTTQEQEQIAAHQAVSVNETNITIEELGAAAQQSAQQADSAANASRNALEKVKKGVNRVEMVLEDMVTTKEKVVTITQQILALSEQTSQIRDVAGFVSDFANETKMLAMNAAVEAVRAGEHGKGFSVLAVEIRKLADESKQSAGRISTQVAEIQKAADHTVMISEEGVRAVEEGSSSAHNAIIVLHEAGESVNGATENAQQISLNTQQQSLAVRQVVEAMQSLNTGAKETSSGISQVKVGVETLNQAAKNLRKMV
jgi:methyl-accepting chemotaxis protein